MKKILLIILFITSTLSARIAVLPYKVYSSNNTIKSIDYPSLMSSSISLEKNITVLTTQEVHSALKLLGINTEESLTRDNLQIIAKKYDLDYILTGSLSSSTKGYHSKSILYSSFTNEILSRRTIEARSIIELAKRETKTSLSIIPDRTGKIIRTNSDIAFMIDLSYNNRLHWEGIKKSIISYSRELMDMGLMSCRIYIIPYSQTMGIENVSYSEGSLLRLKKILNRFSPRGKSNINNFSKMIYHTVNNIKWRKNSIKKIYLVNNSNIEKSYLPEKISSIAKRKDISINSISGYNSSSEGNAAFRLSEMTNGKNFHMAYKQTVYDKNGKKHYIYMTKNRLFHSLFEISHWEELPFKLEKSLLPGKTSLPEEIYSTDKFSNPEQMSSYYSKANDVYLIKKEKIKTNISGIFRNELKELSVSKQSPAIAKALVSDGKLNFWVNVKNKNVLKNFKRAMKKGFFINTAFSIVRNNNKLYNIDFIPINASIPFSMIPDIIKVKMTDVVSRPDYYSKIGIGHMPTWFIDVKIQKIKYIMRERDIREER